MSSAMHVPGEVLTGLLTDRGERPGADRGHPRVRAIDLADHEDLRAGIWECTAGGWPVSDRPDVELCLILDGHATISDDDSGTSFTVTAGDLLVLPAGWTGRWHVSDSVRKVFIAMPGRARVPIAGLETEGA